jgi:DNA invertase Pin-like site-specific DNA recombinase
MEKVCLRAVGYRRVSMRDQLDGHSLDAQDTNIRAYALSRGWEFVGLYEDAGISAKKESHRPGLERLMADAQAEKFDVVIVDKIDRFYRHLAGFLAALDQLHSWNVTFASVQEQLDFTSPWGKLMLTVLGILAEIYLDNLRQETRKGKLMRAKKGFWNGLSPFGYCRGLCSNCKESNGPGYCPFAGGPNKSDGKILIAHPIDSQVVRQVYTWYLEGTLSDALIAERLNQNQFEWADGMFIQARRQGHPGISVSGPFKKDTIRDMLKRVFYTGKLPYCGTEKLGDRRVKRSALAGAELFEGRHPALISEEIFAKVQELRLVLFRNVRYANGHTVLLFPFSGILRCGYCGAPMRGSSSNGRRYYRDGSRIERTCDCPQITLRAEKVENQLKEWLCAIYQENQPGPMDLQVQSVVAQAEMRLERARELYIIGEIDKETFEREKLAYEVLLKQLQNKTPGARICTDKTAADMLESSGWSLPLEQKRRFQFAVETAFVQGNAITAVKVNLAFLPFLKPQESCNSGEGGIRTRGRGNSRHSLSRRAQSSTLAPPQFNY